MMTMTEEMAMEYGQEQGQEQGDLRARACALAVRVPTRELHRREERDRLLSEIGDGLRPIAERYLDAIVERRVAARAHERHAARVAYARELCGAVAIAKGILSGTVAALALIGQGGPGDAGGPNGASQLPLLPPQKIWRWQRHCGPAWIAALRAVAGRNVRLCVREEPGALVLGMACDDGDTGWSYTLARITVDGVTGPVAEDVEICAAVRRAAVRGETVDGMVHTFSSDVSAAIRDIVIAALKSLEADYLSRIDVVESIEEDPA